MQSYKPKSPKHNASVLPAGFDALVANGGKIKDKTRYLFHELMKKPLVTTSDAHLSASEDSINEGDDFFKSDNSKVPTQDEVNR